MCAYLVRVGIARGAGQDLRDVVCDVIAPSPLRAAMIAEKFVDRLVGRDDCYSHAKSVDQIFPPMGPTAVAA
jgi:hypothetical protein